MARWPDDESRSRPSPLWWLWPGRLRREDPERYDRLPEWLRLESKFCADHRNWRDPSAAGWDGELERAHAVRRWQASVVGWLRREGYLTPAEVDVIDALRPVDRVRFGDDVEAEHLYALVTNGPPSPPLDLTTKTRKRAPKKGTP